MSKSATYSWDDLSWLFSVGGIIKLTITCFFVGVILTVSSGRTALTALEQSAVGGVGGLVYFILCYWRYRYHVRVTCGDKSRAFFLEASLFVLHLGMLLGLFRVAVAALN